MLVHESVYEAFLLELAAAMRSQLKLGSGFDKDVTQGPLINAAAMAKVTRLVEDSRAKGGRVVMGGKARDDLGGHFYEPTLIGDVSLDMQIAREEIFGPVVSVIKSVRSHSTLSTIIRDWIH